MTDQLSGGVVQPTDAQIEQWLGTQVWFDRKDVKRLLAFAVPQAPLQAEPVARAESHGIANDRISVRVLGQIRKGDQLYAASQAEPVPVVASELLNLEAVVDLVRRVANAGYGYGPKGSREEFDRAYAISPLQLLAVIRHVASAAATPQAEPVPVAQVVAVYPPGPDGPEVNWLGKTPKVGTLLYAAAPANDAVEQFEFIDVQNHVMRREMKRIAKELRAYNPAGDEYKGAHIHGVWARELEAAYATPPAEPVPVVASEPVTGFQNVPREPTMRMGKAGMLAGAKSTFAADMIYRAMIGASPIATPQAQFFEGYLCRASGETDLPVAEVVRDLAGVRRFMVREWWGEENPTEHNSNENMGDRIMDEIAAHDWREEGVYSIGFEIGGVSVERVTGIKLLGMVEDEYVTLAGENADEAIDAALASAATEQSETDECPHGNAYIVHDCLRCGASVCCGKCCAEDTARRATPQAEPAVAERAREHPQQLPDGFGSEPGKSQCRDEFEQWYTTHAFDLKASPLGSRDAVLQWSAWMHASVKYAALASQSTPPPESAGQSQMARDMIADMNGEIEG